MMKDYFQNKWIRKPEVIKYFLFFAFVLALIFILSEFTENNYKEINVTGNISIDNGQNVDFAFAPPSSRDKYISMKMEKNEQNSIKFKFKKPVKISGISLFFTGNLTTQISFGAEDIAIYYQDKDKKIRLFAEVTGNRKAHYEFFSKKEVKTSKIKITFDKPFYGENRKNNLVLFNDLKFFEKAELGFAERVRGTIGKYSHSMIAYFFYYTLFFALLFIPGYVLMNFLRQKFKLGFNDEVALVFSPIFGIVVMFASTIAYLMTDIKLFLYAYAVIAIVFIASFLKAKLYKGMFQNKTAIIFMVLALFLIFLVVGQRDYLYNLDHVGKYLDNQEIVPTDGYTGYFVDNLFPWRIASVYFNNYSLSDPAAINLLSDTTVYDRTPLLPMITSVVMNFFGEGHFVFQRFLEVLAVLFIGAFYVLFSWHYSRKVSTVATLLILLNIPIFLIALNAEIYYKFFSIYPIILAALLFFYGKKYVNLGVGILITIAFLIHPSTLIYSLAIFFLYLLKYKFRKELIKNALPVTLILFLAVASWYIVPKVFGGGEVVSSNSNSFYLDEIATIDENLYITKLVNFAFLFVPNILLVGEDVSTIFSASDSFNLAFFRYSFLSNITPFFFILLLIYVVRNFKKDIQFISLGIMPLFFYWLFYLNQFNFFYYYGGAYFILYPLVIPVLLAFITNNLMKQKIYYRVFFFITYAAFMAFNLHYISGVFIKIKHTSAIASLFTWIILGVYAIIFLVALHNILIESSEKKSKF